MASMFVLALLLAACSAATSGPASTGAPSGPASPVDVASGAASTGPDASSAEPGVPIEPWLTTPLTDVRTGESFAIADLDDRLVVVEPMAIWCSNCLRQQREAAKALAAIDDGSVVYISLDIDPTERAEDLAAYATDRGFHWRFVVADRTLSRALAERCGDRVLSPPSTPRIVVTPAGEVIGPEFGITDASTMEAELRGLLS
jgi:hypothetical protein